MSTATLHRYSHNLITLHTAVQALPGAVGYLYAPRAFWVARVRATGLEAEGLVLTQQDLTPVYEARLANATAELRWLRDPADAEGRGRAALVSEAPLAPGEGWQNQTLPYASAIDTPLLLTALAAEVADGWLTVNAPRQGQRRLPWDGPAPAKRTRLAWRWREYLGPAAGEAGGDGNVTVLASRLAGLIIAEEGTA